MYEDPNVMERQITAVFTYASDDENAPVMHGELVERIVALAADYGCEVEIDGEVDSVEVLPRPAPAGGAAGPEEFSRLEVGARVWLRHDVDRYPHFRAPEGAMGTVIDIGDPQVFAVKLDDHIPGAEEWENEIHWSVGADDPAADLETEAERAKTTNEWFDRIRAGDKEAVEEAIHLLRMHALDESHPLAIS